MNEYLTVLKKYAEFNGRARRREYWMFALVNFIIGLAMSIVTVLFKLPLIGLLYNLYALAILIPGLAVSVRRMHDTGRSGWSLCWSFLPIIGWIIVFIFAVQEGVAGENQYGPDPKAGHY